MSLDINLNDMIGAMHLNCLTGKWRIVGASDEMSETFDKKMKANTIYYDDVIGPDSVELKIEGVPITNENYHDFRKPTGVMPKHCYGTSFGYTQTDKIKQRLKAYYINQEGTEDELKKFFKDCCKDMRVVLAQENKTNGVIAKDNIQIILDTYEQFRMSNSVMAKMGCDEEGKKAARENGWSDGQDIDWVYYNADFYYESEKLRALFKEAAQELADEWNCGEIDTSTRDIDTKLSYSSSFHEIWKHGSENGARISSMLDLSVQPPEGFYFFFRETNNGGKHVGMIEAGIEGDRNIRKEIIFGILDKTQKQLPQFYHLYDALLDTLKGNQDSAFKEYLKNFDIFTRYYGTVRMRS